jgi:predicted Rossmann fold flavoprotein
LPSARHAESRAPGPESRVDVLVVGAGAAGLATAIFVARHAPHLTVRCVDGARRVGAKILVSGGSRCNVTNRVVTDRDFWGGPSRVVRSVLRAFPADRAAAFFEELGVPLNEEEDGKLFPASNRSRTVLDALLEEIERRGVTIGAGERVNEVRKEEEGFRVVVVGGVSYHARRVVLATGGRSLPKTGSDGFGYTLARRLGHGLVETTPALAPMLLEGDDHQPLAGVSHPAALILRADNRPKQTLVGAMLWTHVGVSGPAALNVSRHWHRMTIEGRTPVLALNVCPGDTCDTVDRWLVDQATARPKARVETILALRVPGAVAETWCRRVGLDRDTTMAHLAREDRRRLSLALTETVLPVSGSRGYGYAEVTAGGVPLDEIDPATMESRVCPALYLVGEMLDVDGRLGGFNFQWAWSSGWVAGRAIGAAG